MKLILLVFVQMCLIALVFSDDPQKCGGEYDDCPPGYECDYDKCVKVAPTTTTTTKKPTSSKPKQCCWSGNRGINCYECKPSLSCYKGIYCEYVPPTRPPTTTLKPTPCKNNSECPSGYKCENKLCVIVHTQCCWRGNDWRNCYTCSPFSKCKYGNYCHVPPTRPPTTTLKPTPCKNNSECPSGYECHHELCVPKPTQCCWSENRGINCYTCKPSLSCYKGYYCEYVPPTTTTRKTAPQPTPPTTPPTTTTPPQTTLQPCGENGECSKGFKCEYDVCNKDY